MEKWQVRLLGLLLALICLPSSALLAQSRWERRTSAGREEAARIQQEAGSAVSAARKPWLGAVIKDGSEVSGAWVTSVLAGSPAEKAGIRAEDIIVRLADRAIADAKQLAEVVSGLKVGADYPVIVVRGGRKLELTVRPELPSGRRARFPLAATTPAVSSTAPARTGPLDINVLKYALISPGTGEVTFVGKYDPAYATGPLPYGDYLRVALDHLYPAFSLDPPPDTPTTLKQAQQVIDADLARMEDPNYCNQWAQQLTQLLLHDESLQADRNRLYRNCARALQMSPEDFQRMYDAATGKRDLPATEFMGLAAKMVRGVGLTGAGEALAVLSQGGTPEELLFQMAKKLGLSSQYQELAMRGLPPGEFRQEEIILCMAELCRQFGAPERELQQKIAAVRAGESANLIIDYMGEKLSDFVGARAGRSMIDGLVLGPEVLAKLYRLPLPRAELVFTDLPSDSQLGEVFFASDYRLKSLCAFPEAGELVPDHLTQQQLMRQEATVAMSQQLCNVNLLAGNRLVPGEVMLRTSPAGDVVAFGPSQLKILGWIISLTGQADRATVDFLERSLTKYAERLTERYDSYAKAYPEWHRLAEAAKVIALARWARSQGKTLKIAEAPGPRVSLPPSVNGFWTAVFEVNDTSQYLTFVAEGGASFGRDEGEGWLKAQPDVTVTSEVSKQLVASAAFAEQAVEAALAGELEAARELAEKSAQAMTGEIDLTQLPSLDQLPLPDAPAAYAAATRAAIDQAAQCLEQMDRARQEAARAQQLAPSSPAEAEQLQQQATAARATAEEKLQQVLAQVKHYRAYPSQANQTQLAQVGGTSSSGAAGSGTAATGAGAAAASPSATTTSPGAPAQDWNKLAKDLHEIDQQIAATRAALLRLNASIRADRQLFAEWERTASEGLDRCVSAIGDIALDFGITGLSKRHETMYELAKKLPGRPEEVIEKYRYLASLTQRLKEAKATQDLAGLAARENKTEAELWETLRDGLGQISGLLSLDETVPGKWWKYGTLAVDTAYNLTELRATWKNLKTLEENQERYAEAVRKLAARMKDLMDRKQAIMREIELGRE